MHADGDVGMNDARGRLHRRMFRQFGLDQRAIAEQQKLGVGVTGQRNGGAGNDDGSADIATHGVKRDSNLLRHERPGNLISCGLEALGRGLGIAMNVGDRPGAVSAPRPGRDNSVSPF